MKSAILTNEIGISIRNKPIKPAQIADFMTLMTIFAFKNKWLIGRVGLLCLQKKGLHPPHLYLILTSHKLLFERKLNK